jgi:N-methylhydantoinase A
MALENAASDFELNYSADICFVGQSHTLAIPLDLKALRADGASLRSLSEAFVQEHRRIYGHGEPGPTRIVNLGAVASVSPPWSFDKVSYETVTATRGGTFREAIFNLEAGPVKAKVVERHSLAVGDVVVGPAILEQSDTTTLVSPGWTATVITGGNIMMERN